MKITEKAKLENSPKSNEFTFDNLRQVVYSRLNNTDDPRQDGIILSPYIVDYNYRLQAVADLKLAYPKDYKFGYILVPMKPKCFLIINHSKTKSLAVDFDGNVLKEITGISGVVSGLSTTETELISIFRKYVKSVDNL